MYQSDVSPNTYTAGPPQTKKAALTAAAQKLNEPPLVQARASSLSPDEMLQKPLAGTTPQALQKPAAVAAIEAPQKPAAVAPIEAPQKPAAVAAIEAPQKPEAVAPIQAPQKPAAVAPIEAPQKPTTGAPIAASEIGGTTYRLDSQLELDAPSYVWSAPYMVHEEVCRSTPLFYDSAYLSTASQDLDLLRERNLRLSNVGHFRASLERGLAGDYRNFFEKYATSNAVCFYENAPVQSYLEIDDRFELQYSFVPPRKLRSTYKQYRPFVIESSWYSRSFFYGHATR